MSEFFVENGIVVMALWLTWNVVWILNLVEERIAEKSTIKVLCLTGWLVAVVIGFFPILAGWMLIVSVGFKLLDYLLERLYNE